MKDFYNALKQSIQTWPGIQHVNKWNNQILNLDDEVPFNMPAVFIEIESVEWQITNKTTKKGIVTTTLHIITECYDTRADDEDALKALDLIDEITERIEALKLPKCSPFTNTSTIIDNDHGGLIENKVTLSTEYTRCVGSSKTYTAVEPDLKVTGKVRE